MFETLKTFGQNIGADIVPDFQQPEPQQSTVPAPTPLGQPTKTPRFSGIAKAFAPLVGKMKESAKENFVQPIQEAGATIKAGTQNYLKSFKDNFGMANEGVEGLKSWMNYALDRLDSTNYNKPASVKEAILGTNLKDTVAPKPEEPVADDVAKLFLGSLGNTFNVVGAPVMEAFNIAGETRAKPILEFISNSANEYGDQIGKAVDQFAPGLSNILSPEMEKNFRHFLGNMIIRGGIAKGGTDITGKLSEATRSPGTAIKPANTELPGYKASVEELFGKDYKGPVDDVAIQNRFKQIAQETHPDIPGGGNIEAFQKANQAKTNLLSKESNLQEQIRQSTNQIWEGLQKDPTKMQQFVQTAKMVWNDLRKGVEKNQVGLSVKVVKPGEMMKITGEPVPEPKNVKEYKDLVQGMLNNETISKTKALEMDRKQALKETMPGEQYQTINNHAQTIVDLATKLDIVPEATPQPMTEKIMERKIAKETSPFKKDQLRRDYTALMEAQRFMEEQATALGVEPEDFLDDVHTANVNIGSSTPERSQTQLQQIEDFIVQHKDIKDPVAKAKLQRVLAGEKVKDNGIDYNKEIEAVMERELTPEAPKVTKDITDIIKDMEVKERQPIVQETKPIAKKLVETPASTTPAEVPQATVDRLVDKFKSMVTEEVKSRIGTRFKDKTMTTILKKFAETIAYQPKMKDIKEAYKDPRILYKALTLATERSVLDKAEVEVMNNVLDNILKDYNKSVNVVNKKPRLDDKQKAVFLKREDYKTPIKGVEDIKIKIDPINDFLKENPEQKIHIIETPTTPTKKPFAMMGTKETTYARVHKPHVLRAIEQGQKIYIEPYGGVGTALYHLPEYFRKGLEEATLNLFDVEKYTIINAIKQGTMNVKEDVTKAYDTIVKEITDRLMTNDEFKKIYSETQIEGLAELQVGSKDFREALMLLGFHPELARQFFKENLDAKVAIKGELTQTFKDRVGEKLIAPKLKSEFPDLEGPDLQEAITQGVDDLLSKPGIFEKQYAGMSEEVKATLDKYDSDQYVSNIEGDHNKALLTAVARHFRQRGVSGQRVISPSDGFNSIEGVRQKMIETLGQYDEAFRQYGDKINLFNEDGQKFINDQSYKLRAEDRLNSSIWYSDPPYVHSNQMYIKNNPELRHALGQYSDYQGIKEIFRPAVGETNTLLFTNDVDGKYFQSVKDLLGERMGDNMYAYKEGLTPTSFITTKDINGTMKQNKFMYYILNKNAKIMNALQFIDELGGDIAEGLKKNITKILSYVSPEMQKTLDKLEKIRSGVVKAQTEVENVEHALEYVTSKSEAQKLLRESKQNLNKGYLTGKPLMKLINIVQRNIQNLNVEQRALRKRLENFEKSSSADAEIKKRFFEQFNKEYTTKKLTQDQQRESDVKSIYSLNFDEVDALNKTIKEMSEMARNSRIKTDEQKAEEVRYQVEETKSLIEQGKAGPLEKREQDAGFVKGMTKAGLNAIDQYYSFANYMYERLGLSRMKKQVDQAKIRIDDKEHEMITPIMDRIKTYNMKHQDMQKIGVYGLANRGDGFGETKLFAYLTKIGDPLAELSRGEKQMKKLGKKTPLTEEEARAKIDEYKSPDFLTDKQKKIYDMMREQFDTAHKIGSKTMLDEKNTMIKYVENYRPIVMDRGLNKINFQEEDFDMSELQKSMTKMGVTQTLDKQTTAKETIPLIEARGVFSNNIRSTIYFAEMQPVINKLRKVVNELGSDTIGERGYNYITNKDNGYLVDLARQGRNVLSRGEKFTEKLISGFSKSVLLMNPSTLLKQMTNIFDTAMTGRGGPGVETMKRILSNPKYVQTVLDRSTYLRNRMGHDKIKVLQDTVSEIFQSNLQKLENLEGKVLNGWDMLVGITINDTYYRQGIAKGLSHKEAQYMADYATKEAIGSFEHTDLPQMSKILKGYLAPLRMFQTFVRNRYNLVRYKTFGEKVEAMKMTKNIMTLLLAGLVEAYIGYIIAKKLWKSKKERSRASVLGQTLTSFVPTIGNVINTDMYGNVVIDPLNVPSLDSLGQGLTTLKKTGKVIQGKESVSKYLGTLLSTFGPVFGLPSSVPLGRAIKTYGPGNTSSSGGTKLKSKKLKSKSLKSKTIR